MPQLAADLDFRRGAPEAAIEERIDGGISVILVREAVGV